MTMRDGWVRVEERLPEAIPRPETAEEWVDAPKYIVGFSDREGYGVALYVTSDHDDGRPWWECCVLEDEIHGAVNVYQPIEGPGDGDE